MNNYFWLGVYPGMTKQILDYIVDMFKNFFYQISLVTIV